MAKLPPGTGPFRGIIGVRPRIVGPPRPIGRPIVPGVRGPGFKRQRMMDREAEAKRRGQKLVNERAVNAARELRVRGEGARSQKITRSIEPGENVSERLLRERFRPLQSQRFAEKKARKLDSIFNDPLLDTLTPEPNEIGNVNLRLLKERTQPLRTARQIEKVVDKTLKRFDKLPEPAFPHPTEQGFRAEEITGRVKIERKLLSRLQQNGTVTVDVQPHELFGSIRMTQFTPNGPDSIARSAQLVEAPTGETFMQVGNGPTQIFSSRAEALRALPKEFLRRPK